MITLQALENRDKEDVNKIKIEENLEILKRTKTKTLVHPQTLHLIVILMTTLTLEEETLERVTKNQEILLENLDNLENKGNLNLKNLNLKDQDLKNQDLTLTNLETREADHLVNLEDKILETLQDQTLQEDLILQEDQTNLETNLDLTDLEINQEETGQEAKTKNLEIL